MKRILLTGASGHLGSALANLLVQHPFDIRMVSRRPLAPRSGTTALVQSCIIDLAKQGAEDALVADRDTIIHLAGSTARAACAEAIAHDRAINLEATERLIAAAARVVPGAAFVLAGSESQHGPDARLPLSDNSPDDPRTPYDRHKTLAEAALAARTASGALRGVRLRFPTIYGAGTNVAAEDRGVVVRMITRALTCEPIEVFGDGSALRDFLHVEDAAAAVLAAACAAGELAEGSSLVGTGESHSIVTLARTIQASVRELTGVTPAVRHVDPPAYLDAADMRNVVIDCSRFRRISGWAPRMPFTTGIVETTRALIQKKFREAV